MDKQRIFRITINGISESISQIDSLIAKINTLEGKINALNKGSVSINVQTTGGGASSSQAQQAQQVAEVQKQITIEIDRQNQELREQASFVDSTKQASSEVLDIANSILGTYGQNLAKLDELNQRIAANKQAQKEVADALKNEAIDAQTAAESRQRLLDEELRLKQARSETQAILKNEVKLTQAQTGSYDQMSQTLGRLRDALRASGSGLSPEAFDKVSQAVDKLDEELKSADKSVGQFYRNVGNYSSAADGFGKITVTIAGVNREFESARSAIMELRNAMAQLVASGQQGTEAYKALEEQMKNLQLAMITVNDSIDRAKDASAGLHDAVEAIQGLAAIGSIGQGFASLFGIDDSALGEQIKKLTSLMAIMQGLQQLATQMATGTGIGPALKKVLDVSGINNDWNQLKESLTVIGQRLGIVKTQAEGAAVGMGALAASAKVAEAAVKGIGRALLIGFLIEGVVWTIELLVDGFKALYDVCHDWLSMEDDVERANEGLEHTVNMANDAIDAQTERIDNMVSQGMISKYDGLIEKQEAYDKILKDTAKQFKENIDLQVKAGNIQPKLANWDALTKKVEELTAKRNAGIDVEQEWNKVMTLVLDDAAARIQNLDMEDSKALEQFMEWMQASPIVKEAIRTATDSGIDGFEAMGNQMLQVLDFANRIINMIRGVRNEADALTQSLERELELRRKYGKDWSKEGRIEDAKKEVDESGLSENDRTELKKLREQELREQAGHSRKKVAAAKRTAYDLTNIERQIQADKIAIMRDGLTKTIATIEQERRARLEAIKKYPASKQEEARVAANARYDKEVLDAQKKFHDDYEKAEKDFLEKIRAMNHEIFQSIGSNEEMRAYIGLDMKKVKIETDKAKLMLANLYDELYNIGKDDVMLDKTQRFFDLLTPTENFFSTYEKMLNTLADGKDMLEKYDEKMAELAKSGMTYEASYVQKMEAFRKTIEGEEKKFNSEVSDLMNEWAATSVEDMRAIFEDAKAEVIGFWKESDLNKIKQMFSEAIEIRKRLIEETSQKQILGDNPIGAYVTWSEYYSAMLKANDYALERHTKNQRELIGEQRDFEITSLQEQMDAELDALKEKHKAMLEDTEAIKQEFGSRIEAEKQFHTQYVTLEETWKDKIKQVDAKYAMEARKQDSEELEQRQKLYSDFWNGVINEVNIAYGKIINEAGKIEQRNTNEFGILNLSAFRKQTREAIDATAKFTEDVTKKMEMLREDLANKRITLGDFSKSYRELDDFKKKIEEDAKEMNEALKGSFGTFWKGIDDWIQQVAQSFQQVLSAIFDFQNGEFDRLQEAIDKELDAVQKKYDEMEELAQKHKDAMNEIENELSTARGDRRAHLIDALSAEIQAQRDALAAQRKAEKEKEALEKKSDKLELQRKKQQRKQDIIQAILNGALAISQASANRWPIPAVPLMALAAATTAAQVAIMSKTHYAKGGLLEGKSHAQGGIPVGNTGIEVEGNEFVTNKKTTMKNLDLLYYINSKKRRLDIGDFIDFYTKNEKTRKPIINNRFAEGGLTPNIDLAERLVNVVVERDNREIVVSVVDIARAQDRLANVRELAGD